MLIVLKCQHLSNTAKRRLKQRQVNGSEKLEPNEKNFKIKWNLFSELKCKEAG
jgi:hypothetical protein